MKIAPPLQRGFAAIAAIFLLVVLAALGAFMLTFSNTQQLTSAQDLQGSRAYWAARAGLEWGLGNVIANPAACPVPPAPFAIEGFDITIGCARQSFGEGGGNVVIFRLEATATQGGPVGSVSYIERSVSASVEIP
jgi:MSHA biogenesis protein MshP